MKLIPLLGCLLAALSLQFQLAHAAAPGEGAVDRPVIEKKDDLPRHSYQLDIPVASLYAPQHRETLLALGRALANDTAGDLEKYEIRDNNTVQDYYSILGSVAILEERWQDYLEFLALRRELESKEANRLTMGLIGEAVARVKLARPEDEASALQAELTRSVQALPYTTVQDNIKGAKGSAEILTPALVLGSLESRYQTAIDNTGGKISHDIASALVGSAFTIDHYIPAAPIALEVYSSYIAANEVEKKDIWEARKYDLADDAPAQEVVVAVWDSGVDTDIFEATGQMWTNSAEIPANGIDDDDNNFVDDVHGIAYDLDSDVVPELLQPIERKYGADPKKLQVHAKGMDDIYANIDSPEATELRKLIAALPQEEVEGFMESIGLYSGYAHGTHVSGIALEGNPFARLLVARMTYNHKQMPIKPTIENAHKNAEMFRAAARYFREQQVRAVNMSWGGSLRGIESALEAHNAGGDADERKALARKIYAIGDAALREVIEGSPDILFITSAGNSDNDVKFDEFYPSSYEYPNLISVGAVDIAGDETSFTSLGKVDIYASGHEVESYVPGGDRLRFSGTSMSSPQVLNLASKLLALAPDLSVQELLTLIMEGADEKQLEARTIKLMNPRASIALLQQRQAR